MPVRLRIVLPILLLGAYFLVGEGVPPVHGTSGVGIPCESVSLAIAGPRCHCPAVRGEGTGSGACVTASRRSLPKRRRWMDDDSDDDSSWVEFYYHNANGKTGKEACADFLPACATEKEDRRMVPVLFPERRSGEALSALCSSLLLGRPPPPFSEIV